MTSTIAIVDWCGTGPILIATFAMNHSTCGALKNSRTSKWIVAVDNKPRGRGYAVHAFVTAGKQEQVPIDYLRTHSLFNLFARAKLHCVKVLNTHDPAPERTN